MNSDLYGKVFPVPQDVIDYLHQCHSAAGEVDETTEGYKRNKDLREKKQVSYQQLKRMKNWFDNFTGHEDEIPHILNGGHYVKNWVNNTLDGKRDSVETSKQTKSVVLPNQYNDEYKRDDLTNMNRPSKSHNSSVNSYDAAITENLKRINQLIQKIL
jgi:hypothetical protein